jgi:hypothetical protein
MSILGQALLGQTTLGAGEGGPVNVWTAGFEDELLRSEAMLKTISTTGSLSDTVAFLDEHIGYINRIFIDTFDLTDDEMEGLLSHPMIDTWTLSDIIRSSNTLNLRYGDLLTIYDALSVQLFLLLQTTDTLSRTEVMIGFINHNFVDFLDRTDNIFGIQVNPMYETLTRSDLMTKTFAASPRYGDAWPMVDSFMTSIAVSVGWHDEMLRSDRMRAIRVRFGVFSDSLGFTDQLIRDRIFKTFSDTLDRTETLNCIKNAVGVFQDSLAFSDDFDVSLDSDVALADTLTLTDDFYIYKSGTGIKIFGKFRNICLKSPEFNDFVANQSKLVVPRAMPGNFRTYIKRTANDKLHWQFVMQKPKKDELEQFIETEINNDLLIYDWLGRRWLAKLTTDSFDFVELAKWSPGGNKFEVTLEFEGVRYYG